MIVLTSLLKLPAVAKDVLELISQQEIIQEILSEFLFVLKMDSDLIENTKNNAGEILKISGDDIPFSYVFI